MVFLKEILENLLMNMSDFFHKGIPNVVIQNNDIPLNKTRNMQNVSENVR